MIDTVVFDLGGVVIDWEPRGVFRSHFSEPAALERFLELTEFERWNEFYDLGGSWDLATSQVALEHPDYAPIFGEYADRFLDSISGLVPGSLELLDQLRTLDVRLLALTNWSADAFARTREQFDWLNWFEAIVVSGEEGVMKPDPEIFRRLIERHHIDPEHSAFVDDLALNVDAAAALGFTGIVFEDANHLRRALQDLGIPVPPEHGSAP